MFENKKIVFLTGTRADYGKIKALMNQVDNSLQLDLFIFVTGMHMLSKYGSTYKEIEKDGFQNIHKFMNQQSGSKMDITLSNTITGFSNYISEVNPDLIVVHGDRIEALAGSIVGALNNIKVAHIEGGEVSGTIDESLRHSITKLSHIHFVANEEAKIRVNQLGESLDNIYVIGSPDIDIMFSEELPGLQKAKEHYDIDFESYGILMYHPVTTELENQKADVQEIIKAVIDSQKNYIVIFPNNDEGSSQILEAYDSFENNENIKIFPSLRFEYFLTLLKNSELIIGNSSAGVREAPYYGVPSIDIGNRQKGRYKTLNSTIINVSNNYIDIIEAIENISKSYKTAQADFGHGESAQKFVSILEQNQIWDKQIQKQFQDLMN